MQFTKVDDDAYDVRMNLDVIRRIGEQMGYVDEDSRFDEPDRNEVIGKGFKSAYDKLSELKSSEGVVEVSETESE